MKTMKISELKGGDLIKIKPSHGHEQEYVKIGKTKIWIK